MLSLLLIQHSNLANRLKLWNFYWATYVLHVLGASEMLIRKLIFSNVSNKNKNCYSSYDDSRRYSASWGPQRALSVSVLGYRPPAAGLILPQNEISVRGNTFLPASDSSSIPNIKDSEWLCKRPFHLSRSDLCHCVFTWRLGVFVYVIIHYVTSQRNRS